MRKTITREITHTRVKVAEVQLIEGQPQAVELPEENLIGNVSMEKAQKILNKKYGKAVTIFEVEPNTEVYEMPVETFMEHATLKEVTEAE